MMLVMDRAKMRALLGLFARMVAEDDLPTTQLLEIDDLVGEMGVAIESTIPVPGGLASAEMEPGCIGRFVRLVQAGAAGDLSHHERETLMTITGAVNDWHNPHVCA